MTRIVGHNIAGEFEPDPGTAWRRGRELDALLRGADIPARRGVMRGTHARLNDLDDARAIERALRVDRAPRAGS